MSNSLMKSLLFFWTFSFACVRGWAVNRCLPKLLALFAISLLASSCKVTNRYGERNPSIYSHLIGKKYRTLVASAITSNLLTARMPWDDHLKFPIPAGVEFIIIGVEVSDTPFVGKFANPIAEFSRPLNKHKRLMLSLNWASDINRDGFAALEYSALDPKLAQRIR